MNSLFGKRVMSLLINIIRVVRRKNARILAYHSVANGVGDQWTVTPMQFAEHLQLLHKQSFQICELSELVERLECNDDLTNQVCLTFDDGFVDFKMNVLPLLQAWDAPAALFMPLGKVGGRSDWSKINLQRPLMTWDDLLSLKSLGVTIGSHSMRHYRLPELSLSDLDAEINQSRYLLQEKLGIGTLHFAYPYGLYTKRERDYVQRSGYRSAVIFGGLWGNSAKHDLWQLHREPMFGHTRVSDLMSILNGRRDWTELLRNVFRYSSYSRATRIM